jgi:hypothetical protein
MTNDNRKTTQKGTARRGSAKDKIIRERAARVIANLDAYDTDTRDAIYNALEGVPAQLAELVKRAEAGETILDCTDAAHARDAAAIADLQNFAHHFSETIRIARENPIIPASLYNGLADALIDFENDLPSLARVSESEAHIRLTIDAFIEQTATRAAKGGAR